MSLRTTGDAHCFVLEAPLGKAEVDLRVPGVAQIRYAGLGTGEMALTIQSRLNPWITEGRKVTLFVDAEKLKSYETEFRSTWAAWMRTNRAQLPAVHILFKSKLVEMGISVVNPLIGGFIVPTSRRADFEASLERARAEAERSRPS